MDCCAGKCSFIIMFVACIAYHSLLVSCCSGFCHHLVGFFFCRWSCYRLIIGGIDGLHVGDSSVDVYQSCIYSSLNNIDVVNL